MSYIEVKSLRKRFKKGGGIDVLNGLELSFEKSAFLSIVGASGAGKSTFLHILGGLDQPSDGEVFYEGVSIFKKSDAELALFRNTVVGFVFQFHHLLPEFTAEENVAMPMMIARRPRDEALKRAATILGDMGLSSRVAHKPGELSGGEQQRVAIARALINDPKTLLADEPTGNLDSKTGEGIFDILMNEKAKRGMSLIIVTHNEELARRADVRVRLKDGLIHRE